ncbi:MAG: galactokinase [Candidatus Thorarchaeota archaeon]|nr:galactokinase [Candidatus Thorarchaeota archaeon]
MNIPDGMLQKLESMLGKSNLSPHLVRAPGRIEVLGNHTDYNSGYVLSTTIDKFVWALGVSDESVRLHALDYNEDAEFELTNLIPVSASSWTKYASGIFWAFQRRRHKVGGVTAVIHGDIPQGRGLSSSAALEVALTNLVLSTSGLKLNPKAAAMISFEAERLFCGISCGVMDQFTSQLGKLNSILSINCRNLLTQDIGMEFDASFVVVDSMVTRAAGDAPNERRHECMKALETLQEAGWDIQNLSDIRLEYLAKAEDTLDEKMMKRVTHVVKENDRVRRGTDALTKQNLSDFGIIMGESHASSRDLYEVSHPKLDLLVGISSCQEGVFGTRLTGAGLGGAVLALVDNTKINDYSLAITKEYEEETGLIPEVTPVSIPGGVQVEIL